MNVSKESTHAFNKVLNEMPQNKHETVTANELLDGSKDDYWNTLDKADLKQNVLRNLQRDAHNESNSDKKETYTKVDNEFLNEEFVYENVDKEVKLHYSHTSGKEYKEQNIHTVFNESAESNNSSSDEEVLQTRFPLQNEDECNSPKSSASFASISNKRSITEDYSEIKKPIIIRARAYNEKEIVDREFDDSNSEITKHAEKNEHQDDSKQVEKNECQNTNKKAEENEHQENNKQLEKNEHQDTNKKAEKNEHQKLAIDVANSLSVEADNSNIETESSYRQNSIKIKNADSNFHKMKNGNENSSEDISTERNENTFNQSIPDRNDISPDTIIKDFLNGSFDISMFKPNKNSTMIKDDETVRKQKQSIKDYHSPPKERKYRRNRHKNTNEKIHSGTRRKKIYNGNKHFADSADDSMIHSGGKKTENKAEKAKKTRTITEKNKDDVTSIASDNFSTNILKHKNKSENKYSKSNNQHKRVSSQSKYNDKNIKFLNNFDMENNKKNKIKNKITTKVKSQKNEEIFKGFSNKTAFSRNTRSLRKSSLVASKKIKEIEQLENVDSNEEIMLDSGSSCFDSNVKKIENSFKNIFKDKEFFSKYKAENKVENEKFHNEDTMDITLFDESQAYLEKEGKLGNKITRNNRKRKSKFEDIFDACRTTNECKLKMDKIASKEHFISDVNQLNFLVKENEDENENYQKSIKRVGNKRQSKNDKLTKTKSLECSKNIDTIASYKDNIMNVNNGVITRSKKKSWDMLEKELLGESSDASFSNHITKTVLLKEKSIKKRNVKDLDLYSISDKSVMCISMPTKTNKCDGKYKTQNTNFKHLRTTANKTQSTEVVPYKSRNILERTIAAMEKCTANFIASKETFTEKEYSEAELEDMTDEMSIKQEAEFHSNMTFVTNENEQYYKNKIVAIVKQSSSKKNENVRKKTRCDSEEFGYDFDEGKHIVKKSIITETYSLKGNSEEKLKSENQALITSSVETQSNPWTRLIKELNLGQSKDENKKKNILTGTPSRKTLIYQENVKQYTNILPNTESKIQLTMNLIERKKCKQNEIEKEESEQEVTNSTFEKNLIQSDQTAVCYDLNVQGYSTAANDIESDRDVDLDNVCIREKMEKATRKLETKQKQTLQTKKTKASPKFKLQVVDDGGVKLKRCNRSFSSSSEESIKQKQRNTEKHEKKFSKDQQNSERQKYKRYLNNLFEGDNSLSEKKLEKDKRKTICMTEKNHKNNLVKDSDEQRKMFKALIAKNDDDVFSISSSDSETVNKGSGLLCEFFDE